MSEVNFVFLKDGSKFKIFNNQSIVDAAKLEGINLEHSCLNGRCKKCICKLLSGKTKLIKSEQSLEPHELEKGYILSCARTAITDISISSEKLNESFILVRPSTIPCKVKNIKYLSKNRLKLVLKHSPDRIFKFKPGQYVNLIKGSTKRSYSIAGYTGGDLTFLIKKYENGEFSNYFFEGIKVNDMLLLNGPHGVFFYRDQPKIRNSIFIANGVGIAPILCILEELNQNVLDSSKKIYYLFHGVQQKSDLVYNNEFSNLNLIYFPCLSKENIPQLNFGYAQDVLLQQTIDFKNSEIYACGSESMIKDCFQKVERKGLLKKNFFSDAFLISK